MASLTLKASLSSNASGYWISSDIYTDNYVVGVGHFNSWILFASPTIPYGSTISSAHLNIRAFQTKDTTTVNATLYFADTSSPSLPTSAGEANAIPLTSGANWSAIPTWTAQTWYESPDIASALQSVVNRSDYYTGNNLLLVIRDNGSSANAFRNGVGGCAAASGYEAELHIEYTPPADVLMSGTVSRFGTGISGVTITVSDVGTTSTGGGGTWSKAAPYGWTGSFTPSKAGEAFTPTSLTHDQRSTSNKSNQDFVMNMHITPLVNISFSVLVPTYSYKTNINIVNIAYTAYVPSRNYYEISTTGIAFSTLEPVYSTSYVDVRSRFNLNAIGERISLKFQNVESIDIVLDDVGFTITELYRRDGTKLNAKGNRISLKFQNNTAAEEFELQYIKLLEEVYEHQVGTKLNVLGNHLSFKFQNNTADVPFELQYVKPVIEIYENQ